MQALNKALTGSQSRAALEVLSREEANYRTAVQGAVADLQFRSAAALGEIFFLYLQRSGRLRERDAWVQWLKGAIGQQGFTEEATVYEQQHAWTLFTQGDPQGAVERLQTLIERLRHTNEFESAFQLASTTKMLGLVLNTAGASAQAIPVLREAVGQWEVLIENVGGRPWEELLISTDYPKVSAALAGLSAALGTLADALNSTGQHAEALALVEKELRIDEKLDNQGGIAVCHLQYADILSNIGRLDDADARYDLALAISNQTGDKELKRMALQRQGLLAQQRNQLERASYLYQRALQFIQEAGDQGEMMRTYNLIGAVEMESGRLAEARAWYEKSSKLALQLKDQVGLGAAAQNIGIVWQMEGEAAHERCDEPAARRHFEEARRFVEESLRIKQALGNEPGEAGSWNQLAQIHHRLGDLAAAERHAHKARQIRETLGLKEVWKDYNTLSKIAQTRGDLAAAAEWAKKRDYLRAELKRRAGGGGGLPAQMLQALQALTLACVQAGFGDGDFGPAEEEAFAQLAGFPAPFPDFAAFLRQLAAGQVVPIPDGLPGELRDWVEGLLEEIREAQG